MNGHLWRIIQRHLDDYGVREAEFARRIGTSPQTVSSWKKRGIRSLPDKRLLVGVSDVTRRPYDEVLTAVLHDIEYLPKEQEQTDDASTSPAGVSPADEDRHLRVAARRTPAGERAVREADAADRAATLPPDPEGPEDGA